ncbi:hypothetical protein [Pseudorhodoferax sp.]|uniref:hypothetical protein n=1 Tax=Pseudorhodoferax sp. TaxID=1993553 RepID=UPI002DD63AC8|nr:hypothetical protein [Pseudorhodoferax sp.]
MGYGILRAKFLYRDQLGQHPLTRDLAPRAGPAGPGPMGAAPAGAGAALAVDLAVGLVGKAAESLIDAAAAYAHADAAVLDVTVPLDGFYEAAGPAAVGGGCLVFHDANDPADAVLSGVLKLQMAGDGSAFCFEVVRWKYEGFLQPDKLLQKQGDRDVAFKIEFLTPGSEGLGARAAFVERLFTNVDADERSTLFRPGEQLPWITAPRRPAVLAGELPAGARTMPLNVRITMIETPKPNQLGAMLLGIAKDKRSQIVDWAKDSAKGLLSPAAAAPADPKVADEAGTAYTAYATAWEVWRALGEAEPTLPAAADAAAKAKHDSAHKAWQAQREVKLRIQDSRRLLARAAFEKAALPWPGDLAT